MKLRIHGTRILLGLILSLVLFAAVGIPTRQAEALSGSDFQAGRIMDDGVFYGAGSMSAADIQAFLNAKVPTCDTNGSQPYAGTTAAAYGTSRGYPPPYTCLKDYRQDTVAKAAQAGLCNGYGVANQSAAEIIYGVAQSCGVNPRVLIVMLQKEQGLVTDDWPWSLQYRSAMGYGCPDTAPCDAEYYGFFNQVYMAAWQFKRYAQVPNNYNHIAGRNNSVLYHPNGACGSSTVFIQNQATAGLYNYTPYQPNGAALANLYGTGDGCSSYGNRNFWRYYNDWFGITHAANYSWQLVGQYAYSDETLTTGKGTSNLLAGERVYVGLKARNTGNTTWQRDGASPIKVGTVGPLDRMSPFCDPTWGYGCNRPAALKEASVAPGQIGTFEFWIKAPPTTGTYFERLSLVIDGQAWFPDLGMYFYITVSPPTYTWRPIGQYAYSDQTKTTPKATTNLAPGDRVYVGLKAQNTGNMPWKQSGANTVRLGTVRGIDRGSVFYDSSWVGPARPSGLVEAEVLPGQIGTFEFWMTARNTPGARAEFFAPVVEGVSWMNDAGFNFFTSVIQANYSWQFEGQYAYSDQTKTTGKSTLGLTAGDRVYVGFRAKNTGNVTWQNSGPHPIHVGMTNPLDRLSLFFDSGWLGQNRPARLIEASVAPGQSGTFEFWMKAPSQPGIYREYFSLVAEGAAWMNDPRMNFYMSVQ